MVLDSFHSIQTDSKTIKVTKSKKNSWTRIQENEKTKRWTKESAIVPGENWIKQLAMTKRTVTNERKGTYMAVLPPMLIGSIATPTLAVGYQTQMGFLGEGSGRDETGSDYWSYMLEFWLLIT
jgi:hypothetical protein